MSGQQDRSIAEAFAAKGWKTKHRHVKPALDVVRQEPAPAEAQPTGTAFEIESRESLDKLVRTHVGTLTVRLGPELAGWLLEMNTGNRNMRKSHVAYFATLIREGRWINTGEAIIVSSNGVLNEGQHRLSAIKMTGIPVEADIRFGVPREAFLSTGTGHTRTMADVLSIGSVTNATTAAAVAKIVYHFEHGETRMLGGKVENVLLAETYAAHPAIGEIITRTRGLHTMPLRAAWFAAALVMIAGKTGAPLERVIEFAKAADEGMDGMGMRSAARLLRERLLKEGLQRRHTPRPDRILLTIKAWNSWVRGEGVGNLKVSDHDRSKAGYPVPR